MWAHLGAMLAQLGAMLAHLGAMMAHLGAILAHLGRYVGPSWGYVGPSWSYDGPSCGLSWPMLTHLIPLAPGKAAKMRRAQNTVKRGTFWRYRLSCGRGRGPLSPTERRETPSAMPRPGGPWPDYLGRGGGGGLALGEGINLVNYITLQLQLHYAATTTTTALQHTTSSSCGWGDHCNHCNHSKKKTQHQLRFGPSVDSLCHPCLTTTHLSYSVLSLKLPPPPCAVLLVGDISN